jgi:prephenate dehydrogenase
MTLGISSAAVIGLGLIGGSVARDLAALGIRVSAFDADPAQLALAIADGAVCEAIDASMTGLRHVDLVVIAVPVDRALEVLRAAAPHLSDAKLVTDVGSTKAGIIALAEELGLGARFVGAHPMAGDHRSGWKASRAGLFVDAPLYLCPTQTSSAAAMSLSRDLWSALGARPIEMDARLQMDARLHDARLAWTSHLPHMIAVTLGLTLGEGGVRRDDLGPGGRDMTRIAGSSPEMWTAIAVDNAEEIDRALAVAEREIANARAALARRDARELRRWFLAGRNWFDQ